MKTMTGFNFALDFSSYVYFKKNTNIHTRKKYKEKNENRFKIYTRIDEKHSKEHFKDNRTYI